MAGKKVLPKQDFKRVCEICGNLIGGDRGTDFQEVTAKDNKTRYYCRKCVEAIKRGE